MNRIKVNIITCFNANHKQKKRATDYRSKIGDTLLDVKPFQNPVMKRPLLLTGLGLQILVLLLFARNSKREKPLNIHERKEPDYCFSLIWSVLFGFCGMGRQDLRII